LRIDGLETDGTLSLAVFRSLIRSLGVENVVIESGTASGFHPGRTAAVSIDGSLLGHVGELHASAGRAYEIPGRVAIAELDLAPLLVPPEDMLMKVPSVFPFVDFDLSFVLPDETTVAQLLAATSDAADELLERASVFDEFRGKGIGAGRRAIAIHFRLRSGDRTLSNEEVAPVRQAMIDAAASLGATLRGVAGVC
jgi:phenylalanyl-tRNA synthetase beta chain